MHGLEDSELYMLYIKQERRWLEQQGVASERERLDTEEERRGEALQRAGDTGQ
jgi:hypothetical protein